MLLVFLIKEVCIFQLPLNISGIALYPAFEIASLTPFNKVSISATKLSLCPSLRFSLAAATTSCLIWLIRCLA